MSHSLSPELSSRNGGSSSKRPNGAGMSKLKRKRNEDISAVIHMINEQNQKLCDLLRHANQMQTRTLELMQLRREDKILFINLESIPDLNVREYFRTEQMRIMQKRIQQQQ